MKKILALSLTDTKNICREFIMIFLTVMPVALSIGFRFGMPPLAELIQGFLPAFNLMDHYVFITALLMLMGPMIFGGVIGFLFLDDRDENILEYMAVTPLSKKGYLAYRILFPAVIGSVLFLICGIILLAGFPDIQLFKILPLLIPIAVVASLEAPFGALFLTSFASNKVEGMTFYKAMGIFEVGAVIGYVIHSKWNLLGGIFPSYWITQSFLSIMYYEGGYWQPEVPAFCSSGLGPYCFYLVCGLIVHVIFIASMLEIYNRRAK